MLVNLYSFSKRPNSTKQPPVSDPSMKVLSNVQLKEGTNFLNPVLIVSPNLLSGTFSPSAFNYASIPYWERYYYITDWTWQNGVWECSMRSDPLASFKSQIGNTSAYVLRAAAAYNGNIIDTFYPAQANKTITAVTLNSLFYGINISQGVFVLGVIGNDPAHRIGSVSYYILNMAQMNNFMVYILSNSIYNEMSISEMSTGLYESLFNPFQYVVSCMWYPFDIYSSVTGTIHLGYWDTEVSCKVLTEFIHVTHCRSTIPNHPQIARGNYLKYAPYTRITMYIPPFGSIPVDPSFTNYGNLIYSNITTDLITGQGNIRVALTEASSVDDHLYCAERDAQVGVSIQLAQVASDYMGILSSGASAVTSALTLNPSGIVNGVMNALEASMPKVTSAGVNSSFLVNNLEPKTIVEHTLLPDEDQAEFGRPLFAVRQLNSLSGYIKCGDGDHAFSCTDSERSEINNHLVTGFFYE